MKIRKQKPKIKEIIKEGNVAADMHTHCKYSDGLNSWETMLKKAHRFGLTLCLTDHNSIRGAVSAASKKDVNIIPAIEINSQEGPHILLYFYSLPELVEYHQKYVKNNVRKNPNSRINKSIIDLIEGAGNHNCITSIAHPYGPLWMNIRRLEKEARKALKKADALEVINGAMRKHSNDEAIEESIKQKKGITAGSDAHSLFELGGAITYAEGSTATELLDSIKKHKNKVIGKESSLSKRVVADSTVIKKHTRYIGSTVSRIAMANYNHIRSIRKEKKIEKQRTK